MGFNTSRNGNTRERIATLVTEPLRVLRTPRRQNHFSLPATERHHNRKKFLKKALACGVIVAITLTGTYKKAEASTYNPPVKFSNGFNSPTFEMDKTYYTVVKERVKGNKISINEARKEIALDNIDKLNVELEKYDSIDSRQALNNLSQEEKLDVLAKVVAREIETQNFIIYSELFSQEEKLQAANRLKGLESLWYKKALVDILKNVEMASDAMTVTPVAPVSKGLTFGTKGFIAVTLKQIDSKVVALAGKGISKQIAKRVESRVIGSFEKKLINETTSNITKVIDERIIAKSKNGAVLLKGSRNMGFDHILIRHYTGEYIKSGKATSMFPPHMTREQIVNITMEAVERGKVIDEGFGQVSVLMTYGEEMYGIKELKVVLYDGVIKGGKLQSGTIVTSYPVSGSLVRIIEKG